MILEIITPEETLLESEVDIVSVPGINGEFQMLNNHAPIVSLLTEGVIKFKGTKITFKEQVADKFTNSKDGYIYNIKGGTIEMKDNKVIILVD